MFQSRLISAARYFKCPGGTAVKSHAKSHAKSLAKSHAKSLAKSRAKSLAKSRAKSLAKSRAKSAQRHPPGNPSDLDVAL